MKRTSLPLRAPGKLVRSSRWKSGPSKGQRPLGSECCVATGDSGCDAYTAIAWGVGLSHEISDIALTGPESVRCSRPPPPENLVSIIHRAVTHGLEFE
jgi:hypothetical protein